MLTDITEPVIDENRKYNTFWATFDYIPTPYNTKIVEVLTILSRFS